MIRIPTWIKAAKLIDEILTDFIDVYDVGPPDLHEYRTVKTLIPVDSKVLALVQTTTLANASESKVESIYSIKVSRQYSLKAGQVICVRHCFLEPALVNKTLLIDKVSLNGLALLRKAVASDFASVNQEGKDFLT